MWSRLTCCATFSIQFSRDWYLPSFFFGSLWRRGRARLYLLDISCVAAAGAVAIAVAAVTRMHLYTKDWPSTEEERRKARKKPNEKKCSAVVHIFHIGTRNCLENFFSSSCSYEFKIRNPSAIVDAGQHQQFHIIWIWRVLLQFSSSPRVEKNFLLFLLARGGRWRCWGCHSVSLHSKCFAALKFKFRCQHSIAFVFFLLFPLDNNLLYNAKSWTDNMLRTINFIEKSHIGRNECKTLA